MSYQSEQAIRERQKEQAIRRINAAGGRVDTKAKRIAKPRLPGIKVWGALDCLLNYHKYSIIVD